MNSQNPLESKRAVVIDNPCPFFISCDGTTNKYEFTPWGARGPQTTNTGEHIRVICSPVLLGNFQNKWLN